MITLNDYLYSGDTVLRILQKFEAGLHAEADKTNNRIDLLHCAFLHHMTEQLEHNDYLTSQSQHIRAFYKHLAAKYPFLAFTVKGRIKSLIRSEEKFNGYLLDYIYNRYITTGTCPSQEEICTNFPSFRDFIAYRIVLSFPKCHLKEDDVRSEKEQEILYEIADLLPGFLMNLGFEPQPSGMNDDKTSSHISNELRPYYRDYIEHPSPYGYQSLHITFFDTHSDSYIEVQLRTKEMDDYAEIGPANHLGYEKRQEKERSKRDSIPVGTNIIFDEAYERSRLLQQLELKDVDVNMFKAYSNILINDGCGLYRGRQILPLEHLSRFQNDLID